MKKYEDGDEVKIRAERLVREWTRSGLLTPEQHDRLLPELKVDLRRTNIFLRLVLLGFGILIIAASVLFAGVTLDIDDAGPIAGLCLISAIACYALAEFLIGRFRLYRFGLEESAAVGSTVLAGVAGLEAAEAMNFGSLSETTAAVGLVAAAAAALWMYLRFGYLYAAIASMFCIVMTPFVGRLPDETQRLAGAGLALLMFILARARRRSHGDEFPGDDYSIMQAAAWVGMYLVINLEVSSNARYVPQAGNFANIYWMTYALIWLLPALGLFLAIRDKDRPLLDANLALALITVMTNKPYLGATREAWDPVTLGLVLIGIAVMFRRWLARGEEGLRHGFTSTRILASDKHRLSMVGTAAAAFHPGLHTPDHPVPVPETFKGQGGRSGGAGSTGSF